MTSRFRLPYSPSLYAAQNPPCDVCAKKLMPCSRATLAAGCVGGVAIAALVAAAVAVATALGVAVLCAGPHAARRPPPAAAPNIASAFRRVIRYADESAD